MVLDTIFSEIKQLQKLNKSHASPDCFYLPYLLVLDISCFSKYKNLSNKLLFKGNSLQSLSGPTHFSGYCLQDDSLGQLCCQTPFKWRDFKCQEVFIWLKASGFWMLICFFLWFWLWCTCRRNGTIGKNSLLLLLFTVDTHCFEYQ